MRPNDPFYADQWHLQAIGDIETIWDEYTGAGIAVGVYDEGIQYDHPDLDDRYNPDREVVIDGEQLDGYSTGPHGTSVAGLIAAELNDEGGVGVAFDAELTGINIFDPDSPIDINGASSAGFLEAVGQGTDFDVINNSWGSTPIFARSQNLSVPRSFDSKTVDQYEQISETGRDGLGTVVVQSAGNDHLNANGDGINASRFTITVAAARDDGFTSSYSNYGASVLVTAPAGDRAEEGGRGIVTTDLLGREGYNLRLDPDGRHDYTDDFGGTSAAAPIVTGVVALMLDANPELGWRDVQNILSLSATHTGSEIGGGISGFETSPWVVNGAANWNGGGMHYSQDYGYGMVDAYNAVRMAEAWSLFAPALTSANEESVTTSVEVDQPIEDLSTLEFQFTVDDSDLTIEHVELTLTLTHSAILDLNVYLISPDGTEMMILDQTTGRPTAADNTLTWTFGIDGLRGELAEGVWTVRVEDGVAVNSGTLESLTFTAYGSETSVDSVYHYTDEFSDMVALDAARATLTDVDGGVDWIDLSTVASGVTLDLAAGATSSTGLVIAAGMVIENAVTGDGNDTIHGNEAANELYGMRGGDTLDGLDGSDLLDGGTGADLMAGGGGDDRYAVDDLADVVVEAVGAGVDLVTSLVSHVLGAEVENLTLSGSANINGTGNDLDNTLRGNSGRNGLSGSDGDDRIKGGEGNDRLNGGTGADLYVFGDDDGRDRVSDFEDGSDTCDLTAVDAVDDLDDLFLIDTGGAVLVFYGTGAVVLGDVASVTTIDADDFVFA